VKQQRLRSSPIICYVVVLWIIIQVVPWKKVVADSEKAIVEAMEKQFTEILSPLKESKIFGLKIVKKFTKGTPNPYSVPKEVCRLLYFCKFNFWM